MAFGASATGVDNTALSNAKSIVASAVNTIQQNNGFIGAIMGRVSDKTVDGYVQAERLTWTEGQKMTFPVIAGSETFATVANQAAAIAARTPDAANNHTLRSEFNMTHFVLNLDEDNYNLNLIKGDDPTALAGTQEEVLRTVMATSFNNTLQTHACTSQTQARTTFLGLPFAVDDANAYIGDRSDAAHTNIRSYVSAVGAAINLTGNIVPAMSQIQKRGERPNLIVLGTDLHGKLHGQAINAGTYNIVDKDNIGRSYFTVADCRVVLEGGLDTSFGDHLYLLNDKYWKMFMSSNAMSVKKMENPASVAGTLFRAEFYAGMALLNPKLQGKLTGLS